MKTASNIELARHNAMMLARIMADNILSGDVEKVSKSIEELSEVIIRLIETSNLLDKASLYVGDFELLAAIDAQLAKNKGGAK